MKTNMKHKYLGFAVLALGLSYACTAPSEQNAEITDAAEPDAGAGAELWAQNCIRCHNLRVPDSYTAEQWGVIVHHMRVRASLTAREHRAILRFLQNGF